MIANSGQATATGLAEVLGQAVSHDKITRFLSEREYTSKDLWRAVKAKFREYINGQLVFCQREFRLYCAKKEAS
ncbi:MAG: hypothetical protein K7J15_00100, partial [Candidatus Regiella insecticola]|nr:hypothetical protein [Candidatus Regiella insecticola]